MDDFLAEHGGEDLTEVVEQAYLKGVAEALGLVPEDYPIRVRTVVSHHGSDCSVDHPADGIAPGYCRGVVLVGIDNLETRRSRAVVFGDFPESGSGRYFSARRQSPGDFPIERGHTYGGGWWEAVSLPGVQEEVKVP